MHTSRSTEQNVSGVKELIDRNLRVHMLKNLMPEDWEALSRLGEEKTSLGQAQVTGKADFGAPAGGRLVRARTVRVPRLPQKRQPGRKNRKPPPSWRDFTTGQAADYGWKAYQMAKQLWTLMNVEEKVFDVDGSSGTTITSTPLVVNLSNIAQGSDYYNRIGDSILAQRIEFRARCSGNAASGSHHLRVLIVTDKENQGADPTLGFVLEAASDPLTANYHPLYSQRFTVHYDETIALVNPVGLATGGTSTGYVMDRAVLPRMDKKHNKHIKYDATAGADASNLEGAMFLMAVASDAANGPSLMYNFRLSFTDN
jgi:hypothetical protein